VTTLPELAELVRARRALPKPEERRLIRIEAHVTIKTMAEHLGISIGAMNALERSENPGEKHLVEYVKALNVMRMPEPRVAEPGLTPEEAADLRRRWEEDVCGACGGLHTTAIKAPGACPRIKRVTYDAQGRMLEVEYWADGKWPTTGIVWPDEIMAEE
jgi:transcriptional regulator with XRE-family HTH domain